MNEVAGKKILSKQCYTLEEVVNYLTINHNIIISVDDLIQHIINKELTASIHLNIIKGKVNTVNYSYIAEKYNQLEIPFEERLLFSAYNNDDSELENEIEIDCYDFFDIDITQEKISCLSLYKYMPCCFRLISQDAKYNDLFISLYSTKIKYIFPSQIRILHSSLINFLKLKGITGLQETTSSQSKETIRELSTTPSTKSENQKSEFIKALLYIHYGADVAEKPRSHVHDPNQSGRSRDGKIQKDFELHGLVKHLPSGKTLENWLKGIELDTQD